MKKLIIAITIAVVIISTTVSAYAHPGRTDSRGGHYVRTVGWGYPVGSYHYHGLPTPSIGSSNYPPLPTYNKRKFNYLRPSRPLPRSRYRYR